jgi:hypothetical protein
MRVSDIDIDRHTHSINLDGQRMVTARTCSPTNDVTIRLTSAAASPSDRNLDHVFEQQYTARFFAIMRGPIT